MKRPTEADFNNEPGFDWVALYSQAQDKYIDYLEQINLTIPIVTSRTLECNRCGAIYSLDAGETFGCCVAMAEHRTSFICGGQLIVID